MAPFSSAGFPDSLAIAREDSLTIGAIDAVQKLHVRTVPLGEQPRRLALQEATRTVAVATAGLLGGMCECYAGVVSFVCAFGCVFVMVCVVCVCLMCFSL